MFIKLYQISHIPKSLLSPVNRSYGKILFVILIYLLIKYYFVL
jgi:hypothetical protein